ncbi:response regulator transcription factor [Paenibacillus hexagrammi]|uniref:Response regulator n=1 Tax=Paenibacillus hexagrammi TaxID=2908839 RepID=A0ABY3SDN0_9BACL|nr:response regulator [Paenibacillus sp. YPD9-1]UJF31329.1 response regulator [Paenibacillus sp. YPD9-1]
MWKLMIADDEPRIRNGLRKALPWEEKEIEVVAEAENGLEALDVAQQVRPDLMFVDINMPFMNGLELIERLKEVLPACIVIVISGHDEFSYAQRAVRLNVFDYLLKPVQRADLSDIVDKAIETLRKDLMEQRHTEWMSNKLQATSSLLREDFMKGWMTGTLSKERIQEERAFYGLHFPGQIGLMLIKPLGKISMNVPNKTWDPQLLEFAVKNIWEEMLQSESTSIVFHLSKGMLCGITALTDISAWMTFQVEFERIVAAYLGVNVLCVQATVEQIDELPQQTEQLIAEINQANSLTPIVLMTKKYLETYYYKEDLSLSEVAEHMNVNANYLSKLLKKELGRSFVDYLTEVRIKKAIQYLNDPTSKMYEIAEKVGYHTQHYFSHTFKKMTGVSPMEFRKRGDHV